jgi:hypothetical protein
MNHGRERHVDLAFETREAPAGTHGCGVSER